MTSRFAKPLAVLTGLGAILAAAITGTTAAKADPAADQHFIDMLGSSGMTFTHPDVVIHNGHVVCGNLWAGQTTDAQANAIRAVEPEMPATLAKAFVAIAIQAFCPNIQATYAQRHP